MARGTPIHPDFVIAILILDGEGMPYAELWRLLRPVANRLGEPRPSYDRVRQLAIATRRAKRRRKAEIDLILRRTLAGLAPVPI